MTAVLVLAAHPDDEVLGAGGYISKYAQNGTQVWVAIAAPYAAASLRRGSDPRYPYRQMNQTLEAAKVFGVPKDQVIFSMLSDHELSHNLVRVATINYWIEDLLKLIKPSVVLTHTPHDTHQDHVVLSKAVGIATRPSALSHITLLHFEPTGACTPHGFNPNWYIELTGADIEKKSRALECYTEEIDRSGIGSRNEETIRAKARLRGSESGFQFAEAFQLIRSFK